MSAEPNNPKGVLMTTVRLLTFRSTREELLAFNHRHLILGLACTWLVGIGRYWDNPKAHLLQHLGVGSVVYVFLLALFLWLLVWPLRLKGWSYFRVITFVAIVSPPAVLYAIPVERFFDLATANSYNVWFLLIVAAWRVALLVFFLKRLGRLGGFSVLIVTLLPLILIVITLTMLNLEKVVFNFMGGITEETANDAAYGVLVLLSLLSFLLFLPVLICYVYLAINAWSSRRFDYQKIEEREAQTR